MRCRPSLQRLTSVSPFKAATYKDSMYKNYKCIVNFDLIPCLEDTVHFVKKLVAKDPIHRPTATAALENDIFLSIELDEHQASNQNLLMRLNNLRAMYSSMTKEAKPQEQPR